MSDNIHNVMIPVPMDPNTVHIPSLSIEFLKDFKKEYNEIFTNKPYTFAPLLNTHDVYPMVEFERKDLFGYIKLKNSDLWLHEDGNNLVFDRIKCGEFTERQPLVLWFEYIREREIIAFKYLGYNVESTIKKKYDKLMNIVYLNYKEDNGKIYIRWVDNRNDATKFAYDKIKWNEWGWIRLHNKPKQYDLLGGNFNK
ncbi:hypothetical protein QKU48_gp1078 [Fadolivirus algeromassiliense]|jgi:hypothetical protein|uniref:Uncharacterized protein n=1 Tax=Fadolivirus FV1/VV64 TaxID=3070911 RepID=A0A7D3V7V9_9VIRU|nr:hypothetical protein QKU48_gp1078 [Fadolivirus algeromassiliense]QKF94536.1 hypothetical protein Fadolivirus_1_1078 [Fadolivirus FV1/VV64]